MNNDWDILQNFSKALVDNGDGTYSVRVSGVYFRGVLAAAPSNPIEGWTYINSVDNGYYIYYAGSWQLIVTLSGGGGNSFLLLEDGFFLLLEDGFKLVLE